MHLLVFTLIVIFQGLVFTWICPFLMGPLLGLFAIASRIAGKEGTNRWILWIVAPLAFAGNAYVLWGWAAYLSLFTHHWSAAPEVSQHWLYYTIGFFGCAGPLSSMAAGDRNVGSAIHICLASLAFIAFCIWPYAATAIYGWVLAIFGR